MTVQEQTQEKGQETVGQQEEQNDPKAPKSHDEFVGQETKLELEAENKEEVKEEETAKPEDKEVENPEDLEEDDPDEPSLADVVSGMRTMQTEMQKLQEGIAERDKVLQENGLLEETDPEAVAAQQRAETLQDTFLNQLYQTMLVNPAFPNLSEIVSQENQNALIRDYGTAYAEENGLSQSEGEQHVYQGIMQQPNPILWYYEKSLENYYEAEETPAKDDPPKKEVAKETKPQIDAPSSLGNASGSLETSGKGGYTMKSLDDMSEMQLTQVPQDVRDKHLAGSLPAE